MLPGRVDNPQAFDLRRLCRRRLCRRQSRYTSLVSGSQKAHFPRIEMQHVSSCQVANAINPDELEEPPETAEQPGRECDGLSKIGSILFHMTGLLPRRPFRNILCFSHPFYISPAKWVWGSRFGQNACILWSLRVACFLCGSWFGNLYYRMAVTTPPPEVRRGMLFHGTYKRLDHSPEATQIVVVSLVGVQLRIAEFDTRLSSLAHCHNSIILHHPLVHSRRWSRLRCLARPWLVENCVLQPQARFSSAWVRFSVKW